MTGSTLCQVSIEFDLCVLLVLGNPVDELAKDRKMEKILRME
ncbi:DUF2200 domain-containing protein [Rufibacter latericius]|nr:DUF2200 domain-containing protein [Rufibacter latericius]